LAEKFKGIYNIVFTAFSAIIQIICPSPFSYNQTKPEKVLVFKDYGSHHPATPKNA
jgi:hypothetical protein